MFQNYPAISQCATLDKNDAKNVKLFGNKNPVDGLVTNCKFYHMSKDLNGNGIFYGCAVCEYGYHGIIKTDNTTDAVFDRN